MTCSWKLISHKFALDHHDDDDVDGGVDCDDRDDGDDDDNDDDDLDHDHANHDYHDDSENLGKPEKT